jgi:UDP-N-acetylglucosamine 2-epimerase (non-hydrolysing)
VKKVLVLFGTRPEVIKLAPVIRALGRRRHALRTVLVASGQHRELLQPMVRHFGLAVRHDLSVMTRGQTPSRVCARVLELMDPLLARERPDLLLVQGDTTTAMAGALAAFHRGVPVGHVEAGLRTGDPASPFPEEMNRTVISQLASHHFAPTAANVRNLRREGVPASSIHRTGNPVVDAIHDLERRRTASPALRALLLRTRATRRLVLTTHRRESFGPRMSRNLEILRGFVERHDDLALIFPVHPNPEVVRPTRRILGGHPRIHLVGPLVYPDFIGLLSRAWAIVSDSGGVQEEAPTLGKPLLVLRGNTERPESIRAGVARLVGPDPERLARMLEALRGPRSWARGVSRRANPFGDGRSGERIARLVEQILE